MNDKESRILVALGVGHNPGDVPTVILGISEKCWKEMGDSLAKDVNLVPVGIAAQVLLIRGLDHEDIERQLRSAAGQLQVPIGGMQDLAVHKPVEN